MNAELSTLVGKSDNTTPSLMAVVTMDGISWLVLVIMVVIMIGSVPLIEWISFKWYQYKYGDEDARFLWMKNKKDKKEKKHE